jgi:hypothetical protein
LKKLLVALAGCACLALPACSDNTDSADQNSATAAAPETSAADVTASNATVATGFPKGARIVEENGVTFRVDSDGTRVQLGEGDSRIVEEDGVRYRIDPDGTRVRIAGDGAAIDLPDVDVGINQKGNLDVDIGDKDADGGR